MKKLLLTSFAAAALSLASLSASAAPVNPLAPTFSVKVLLTAACEVVTNNPLLDFGTYEAFVTTTQNRNGDIVIKCTRNLTPPVMTISDTAGSINGLNYTIGTTPTAVKTTTGTLTLSSPDQYTFTVSASMPGLQPGGCTTAALAASCSTTGTTATRIHTVSIAY